MPPVAPVPALHLLNDRPKPLLMCLDGQAHWSCMHAWRGVNAPLPGAGVRPLSLAEVEEVAGREELNGYGIMAPSGPQV
jgi:hypothetical protein